MNKAAIKAELLRSALDEYPVASIDQVAWDYMIDNGFMTRIVDNFIGYEHARIFFLLVAEAM